MTYATVTTANGTFRFQGTYANAALAAVRAHKMIDGMAATETAPNDPVRTQIPYSSVIMVQWSFVPSSSEVEDANCKVRTPAADVEPEPGPDDPGD